MVGDEQVNMQAAVDQLGRFLAGARLDHTIAEVAHNLGGGGADEIVVVDDEGDAAVKQFGGGVDGHFDFLLIPHPDRKPQGRLGAFAEPVSHANSALNAAEPEWPALGLQILSPGETMRLAMRIEVVPA
jgi:hypothetical protein